MLAGGDAGAVPLVGIDYSADECGFAYFNLVYYAPIRLAVSYQLNSITYGNAAYEAKIRRGCRAEQSFVYWRPRRRFARVFGGGVAALHKAVYSRKFRSELAAQEFTLLSR